MSETNAQSQTGAKAASDAEPKGKSAKLIAMEEEMRALELEAARLSVLEKKANLEDLHERLAERQLRRDAVKQTSITNGATLRQLKEDREKVQRRCNHRKGGNGAAGVIGGQGDSLDYAVIKHTMLNGDQWVRCQRCGKTWKPPIKEDFTAPEEYVKALMEYETAKNYPTKNHPSSSYQFRYSDNGKFSREVLRHSVI